MGLTGTLEMGQGAFQVEGRQLYIAPHFLFLEQRFSKTGITWELIKDTIFQVYSGSQMSAYMGITWRVGKTDCWTPPRDF